MHGCFSRPPEDVGLSGAASTTERSASFLYRLFSCQFTDRVERMTCESNHFSPDRAYLKFAL